MCKLAALRKHAAQLVSAILTIVRISSEFCAGKQVNPKGARGTAFRCPFCEPDRQVGSKCKQLMFQQRQYKINREQRMTRYVRETLKCATSTLFSFSCISSGTRGVVARSCEHVSVSMLRCTHTVHACMHACQWSEQSTFWYRYSIFS